jgi:hypothetical protein
MKTDVEGDSQARISSFSLLEIGGEMRYIDVFEAKGGEITQIQ